MANETLTPDQRAAHSLLSELRTRIATQPLPYQYGVEAKALESLWDVFRLAREAMKDNPGCEEFARVATNMLNFELRPFTAKWHRAYEAGVLNSRDGANEFRDDLADVRSRLVKFAESLQVMAYGQVIPDTITPAVISSEEVEQCFAPLPFGIDGADGYWGGISAGEASEVEERRRAVQRGAGSGLDAVGLALSGGGIRSATFCLGVVQVLAERGLMPDVDYLSSVSGGGYTGSFITSLIGSGAEYKDLACPFGPDTPAVRHVRQNAKYLSAVDLKQRWMMIAGTVAGIILNWSAPLAILTLLALAASNIHLDATTWAQASGGFLALTLVGIIAHGIVLRWSAGITTRVLIASFAAIAIFCAAMMSLEWGYFRFRSIQDLSFSAVVAMIAISAPVAVRFLPIFHSDRSRKILFKFTLYAAGLIVPLIAIFVFYLLRDLGTKTLVAEADWWNPLHYLEGYFWLWLILAISGLLSVVINVNLTGPHKLYRDQLANTFIWPVGATDISLAHINQSRRAPYHLINATVNLPSSKSPVLRDRKGDFFVFSKLWSGSSAVEYTATEKWRANGRPVDLATAMAISGAAASPQMGLGSFPTLSALMTLLNIRLGFWIANPKRGEPRHPPNFACILREMTGTLMSEKRTWLNVSDGGHIENMGLYELLRRRCKFIICVDGEADPESTFHGQLTLVRHAQIDFGIRIEPRLDEMRPDPLSRLSKTHAQMFRVIYPAAADGRPAGLGLMLYLKLSLTGDEAELLKRYRLLNPAFPHQSTIDQFYDEEQFEAYRQLGVHVAEGTFAKVLMTNNARPSSVRDWFKQLASNLLEPAKP